MKLAVIMVAHYTYGWTQKCVRSWQHHFPEESLVVFNNNPFPGQVVKNTRGTNRNGLIPHWNRLCQKELNYLEQMGCQIIDVPRSTESIISKLPTHGAVLDFAFKKCSEYSHILHIEPDCKIAGRSWLDSMISLSWDNAVVGLGRVNKGVGAVIEMCPTLWNVKSVLEMGTSFEKTDVPERNTGQQIMRNFLEDGGVAAVPSKEFIHFHRGSGRRFYDYFI